LYCALFFIYETHCCTFAATNEPMDFMTHIRQGQVASRNITTGQNFPFWSLHCSKSNWCQIKKYNDSSAE